MSKSLFNRPVVSLRSGGQIALAAEPIINPHNLKILGWWCTPRGGRGQAVLLADDVREVVPEGLAVNDDDAFSTPEELVRHKEVIDTKFQLLEKTVRTKRQKLGKVADFSYNDGMFVQKLYVARPVTKIFSSQDTLLIDRSQILEVTDKYILVSDADISAAEEAAVPAGAAISSS
ncbi:MAG TPA: hypothetical protein VFW52_00935 [Candidatus Saccharimonadales bacterium]|nr:hypothetical protein [Candidatus Saccharimonadales bacterium]